MRGVIHREAVGSLASRQRPMRIDLVAGRIDADNFVLLGAVDIDFSFIPHCAEFQFPAGIDIRYNLIGLRIDNCDFCRVPVDDEYVPARRIEKHSVRVRSSSHPVYDLEVFEIKGCRDSSLTIVGVSAVQRRYDSDTVRSASQSLDLTDQFSAFPVDDSDAIAMGNINPSTHGIECEIIPSVRRPQSDGLRNVI